MSTNTEVLVAIVNKLHDFAIVRDQHWYRIPVSSAQRWLRKKWPPQWLALYHTKAFGELAFGVHYYAKVLDIRTAYRRQLFPDEAQGERSNTLYHQLLLEPLQQLPKPIMSRRLRRIVFIPTTWRKLLTAVEINDLYHESPLEESLWAEFNRAGIQAERQEYVTAKNSNYFLDFAIYCRSGRVDIETDGDRWHSNPERASRDNVRDNALETLGWKVLRFNTPQIREQMADYCLPTIIENIEPLDGLDDGRLVPRTFRDGTQQMGLFDDQ
jgi:very-short-patch-repair endonuclease